MSVAEVPVAAPPSRDYTFIDGIRGLSALSIAVMHAFLFTGSNGEAQRAFPVLGDVLSRGGYAVPVFIVLSGFVLMPRVGRDGLKIRGGYLQYLKRRARRILPPYYAVLLLFVVMIAVIPVFRDGRNTMWSGKLPVDTGALLSHVFMVHNLNPDWAVRIDGPMWSVATEFQIYFLLPLLLLSWRLVGPWATAALALVGGLGLTWAVPTIVAARVWLLGLFAMGMISSWLVQTDRVGRRTKILCAVTTVVAIALLVPNRLADVDPLVQPVVGAAVALCIAVLATSPRNRLRAVLESRPLVWLGLFSYSIYLVHSPLLALANLVLLDEPLSIGARLAVMWLIVLPAALFVSWLMYWLVERHCMTSHQRREQQAAEPLAPGKHAYVEAATPR